MATSEAPADHDEAEPDVRTITDDYVEEENYVTAEDAGAFLIELGEQLADGDGITISREGWELPLSFGEPVELDVEFEAGGTRTGRGRTDGSGRGRSARRVPTGLDRLLLVLDRFDLA